MSKENYVTCQLRGLLANQMFCISAMFAYAWDHRLTPVLKSNQTSRNKDSGRKSLLTRFKNIPFNDSVVFDPTVTYSEPRNSTYAPIPYKPGDNVLIKGFRQSEKYFKKYRPQILDMFRLGDDKIDYLDTKYGDVLANSVSVHVRTGADRPETYAKAYYELYKHDSDSYYTEALKLALDNDSNIKNILVFSDNIEWCKSNLSDVLSKLNVVYVEGEDDYIDIVLMSMCTHNIIANSTFSWWSAWLNENPEKFVVAPLKWHGETPTNRGWVDTDLIPDKWVRI